MTERWKPETNEMYWFIPKDGEVIPFCWCDDEIDRTCFNFGNCFRTEEEAEAAAEKVKALLLSLHENPKENEESKEFHMRRDDRKDLLKLLNDAKLDIIYGPLRYNFSNGFEADELTCWTDIVDLLNKFYEILIKGGWDD